MLHTLASNGEQGSTTVPANKLKFTVSDYQEGRGDGDNFIKHFEFKY